MKKIVQINSTANWGSTGTIAENIGLLARAEGWESVVAYGRKGRPGELPTIRIGGRGDMYLHGAESRLLDNHGLGSRGATRKFIRELDRLNPDIIHLHNIHGYYLNYPLLFDFLKRWGGPVVWTLHDCWTFTGHCAYFEAAGCDRWHTGCYDCPNLRRYPASFALDRSRRNYDLKRECFSGCPDLTLVPVSEWLGEMVASSFLGDYPRTVIRNGIDLSVFRPADSASDSDLSVFRPADSASREDRREGTKGSHDGKKMLLGVASVWDELKGLGEFIKLRDRLPAEYSIVLVGLTRKQIAGLPEGIRGISRTDSVQELVRLYSEADLLVNPTLEDTFPTVNLEALACGTPVVTYRTGGSPETIDALTGRTVEKRDIDALASTIRNLCTNPLNAADCRTRAERHFDSRQAFARYIDLYRSHLT